MCVICSMYIYLEPPPPVHPNPINPVINLTVNNYNLTMKCLPNNDNFNYIWKKRKDIFPWRAQGVNTSQLTIFNLKPEDSGDYQCVMSNNTGTISSNFAAVNVIGKIPMIIMYDNNDNRYLNYIAVAIFDRTLNFGMLATISLSISVYDSVLIWVLQWYIKTHGSESRGQEETVCMWPRASSGPRNHYSELFTQMVALKFESAITQPLYQCCLLNYRPSMF